MGETPGLPHNGAAIFHKDTHTYSHLMKAYVKPVWGEKNLDDIKHQRCGTFRVNKSRAIRSPPRTARTNRDRELAKHTHCTYPHTLDQPLFIKGQGSQSARVIKREREITNALRDGELARAWAVLRFTSYRYQISLFKSLGMVGKIFKCFFLFFFKAVLFDRGKKTLKTAMMWNNIAI